MIRYSHVYLFKQLQFDHSSMPVMSLNGDEFDLWRDNETDVALRVRSKKTGLVDEVPFTHVARARVEVST